MLGVACYFSWPGSDRLLRRITITHHTHCPCMIGKFSLTIYDPVYFELNWVFKTTELSNTNVVRENAENFPYVNRIYIKYLH